MVSGDIEEALRAALSRVSAEGVPFSLEYPPAKTGAQYATNAALAASKKLRQPSLAVAQKLAALVAKEAVPHLKRVEAAGPGFLNFYLDRAYFTEIVELARKKGAAWGGNDRLAGECVLIEYTSPNLFKPLHIGNLVGNVIGESLARLLSSCGAKVVRLNYPSDIGLTVAKGVWGLRKIRGNPDNITALGEAYRTGTEAYERGAQEKKEIDEVNRKLYDGSDEDLEALRARGVETSRAHLLNLTRALGTHFDAEFFESEAAPRGEALVRAHLSDGIFETSAGAVIFRGQEAGLHTRVFINSLGLPTYEAKDVGNFALKRERYPQFTRSLIVTGGEQHDYFKVVFAALRKLFPNDARKILLHIPTGFLTLATGKMSSRKGNVITGEELLQRVEDSAREKMRGRNFALREATAKQVGVAAIKYSILKQATGKNLVFDPEKSLSLEGDSGPYVQYAHTRAVSILRRAAEEGARLSTDGAPEEVYEPERLLARFPEVAARAASENEPHHLAQYGLELAGAFNAWYGRVRVLDGSPEAPYKLALVDGVRQTLKNCLFLLGIEAPEEM